MQIQKAARQFLSEDLTISNFEDIEPYFADLLQRKIDAIDAFDKWLLDRSELDAVLEEDLAWRYIKMSIDTANEALRDSYTQFVTQIQPRLAPLDDQLNEKLLASPFLKEKQVAKRDWAVHTWK